MAEAKEATQERPIKTERILNILGFVVLVKEIDNRKSKRKGKESEELLFECDDEIRMRSKKNLQQLEPTFI